MIMTVLLLIAHISIALSSLVVATLTAFIPSKFKVKLSGYMIGLTLLSGTILVVLTHQQILSSCETGLIYLALAMVGVIVGVRRLALEHQD
jgi:hypothetical protein